MVKSSWRAAAAFLLAFASPARSGVIDFEDVTPNIFAPDEVFTSGGFSFAYFSGFGVVDSAVGFAFGNAPPNASGQFAAALNGAGIAMEANGAAFTLSGFDFAFIAAVPGLGPPGVAVGELQLVAFTAAGGFLQESLLLPAADANGDFPFDTAQLGALSQPLLAVGFLACVYVDQDCVSFDNFAQFALDNIRVSLVPEGSSLAFVLLALALAGVTRRRPR